MTWLDRYKRLKKAYKLTDVSVAEITGHTAASVNASVSQTAKEFPRWLRLAIVLYERDADLIRPVTRKQLDNFVTTHQFSEIGSDEWFLLEPYKELYKEPSKFLGRQFTAEQILLIATTVDREFTAKTL